MLNNYKVILWDFDGVILDSMPIRSKGFEEVLKNFPANEVDELLEFHNTNGGLSRYVKFRYFFEKIRNESISEEGVLKLASDFSSIMLKLLLNEDLLIMDSVNFIKENWTKYEMHIVSGSDGDELMTICETLNLRKYFKTVNGSPTPKKILVKNILENYGYNFSEVILIGDSINDLDAATDNRIVFFAYNNEELKSLTENYIESFRHT